MEAWCFVLGAVFGVLITMPARLASRKQVKDACPHEWVEHVSGPFSIVYKCKRCLKMKQVQALFEDEDGARVVSKFEDVKPIADGWCDWRTPVQSAKMACRGCGLVHDLELKVLKVTSQDGPLFNADELPWGEYRVAMRLRRNNRSTGQIRRHKGASNA